MAKGLDRPTVRPLWWQEQTLYIVDQTALPEAYRVLALTTAQEVHQAISRLQVRGAPAIGIAAAFGLYLGIRRVAEEHRLTALAQCAEYLEGARPTAVNLSWAMRRVMSAVRGVGASDLPAIVQSEAMRIWEEDRALCHRIGYWGSLLLADARAVLTHCNAGALGTAEWGTALAPLYYLQRHGRIVPVYADETRPLWQGARLTAWELQQAGIPVTVITDSTAAVVLQKGWVSAVVVGADRIAANGDTANKIGTYGLAIVARAHGVPFYVAAPTSTFDPATASGSAIVIETRQPEEVGEVYGHLILPPGVEALNFAFDVTPAEYITAFITDQGVVHPPFLGHLPQWRA